MKIKKPRIPIGMRTVKTAVAVIVSILIVEIFGTSESKMIFAMLGAMAAVEPTFAESLQASLTQIVGVIFGALIAVLLQLLQLPPMVAAGIGIIVVITLYNVMHLRFSPGLPCMIVVMMCIGIEERPFFYASERVWDTAIGLTVGMAINMLVFPYDNSRQIRTTAESLNSDVLLFLEEVFDGDDILPAAESTIAKARTLEHHLNIFAKQKIVWRLKRQQNQISTFRDFKKKAEMLVSEMEVLSHMQTIGRLNDANRQCLLDAGAKINDARKIDSLTDEDIITNYHVTQILSLRAELIEILGK